MSAPDFVPLHRLEHSDEGYEEGQEGSNARTNDEGHEGQEAKCSTQELMKAPQHPRRDCNLQECGKMSLDGHFQFMFLSGTLYIVNVSCHCAFGHVPL